MVERYICGIVNRRSGNDVDCGSGIIATIDRALWDRLLESPSCFQEKYSRSLFESRTINFYVLLTAHGNLYQKSEQKEKPLKAYTDAEDYHLILGDSQVDLLLSECVALNSSGGTSERCIAVSCCGIDSILVLCDYDDVHLDYSLKSHSNAEECSITHNFLLLFLRADVVNGYISNCKPPVLGKEKASDVDWGRNVQMLWRSVEGIKSLERRLEPAKRPSGRGTLQKSMSQIRERWSFNLPQDARSEAITPCCIGAPIVQSTQDPAQDGADTTSVIGIYVGEGKITSVNGIFGFLKGGLGQFLAAVVPNPKTHTVMPSRWKYHITAFMGELQACPDVLELFHHLLKSNGVRILSFSLEGGAPTAEIVSGLEIYAAIFKRHGELHHQGEEVHPCSSNCTCLQQILVDIPQTAEHFARIKDPPENIAVALFQCVESMQHFSYGDYAEEVLKKIRDHLDTIAKKSKIDSNATVNRCFKWIDILAREREKKQSRPHHPHVETNSDGNSDIAYVRRTSK